MNLFFLDYNTYGNRIVKKESSLSDYLDYEETRETDVKGFNPRDGVNTNYTVNNKTHNVGNYLVVADSTGTIKSRWFVMESSYTREGQHVVQLHRDLMVDYWESIKDAPCFIEKATVSENDSAIFNKENMTFNQIKTSETALKDETGCAWVVGYIPKDSLHNNTIHGDVILDNTADYEYSTLSDFPLYDLIGQNYNGPAYNVVFETNVKSTLQPYNTYAIQYNSMTYSTSRYQVTDESTNTTLTNNNIAQTQTHLYDNFRPRMTNVWNNYALRPYTNYSGNNASYPDIEEFRDWQGKVIKASDTGIYYRINFVETQNQSAKSFVSEVSSLGIDWNDNLNKTDLIGKTPNDKSFRLSYNYDIYVLQLEQIFIDAVVTINDTRYHLEDQPYDMFCIPYSDNLEVYQNGTSLFTSNKSVAVNMAIQIGAEAGSANIYDIQLLPYCPVRYMIKDDGTFDIGNSRVHLITKSGTSTNIGVICWATKSAFSFDIEHTITVDNVKVSNECDVYRLTSPNFNGQFEFSAAKNGGVTSFNVDCNYKPFSPYIHVNPNFGRLYGQDFNDARGLICGGDFSLPQVSNAWANYQLQNKNYQEIFDRQIQNMEVNNAINNTRSVIGMLGNAVGTGLGAGGGMIGAALGIGSALTGAMDVALQIGQQQEELDFKKDLFGYNLGNIQALPNSLTKTTAFTYNNKIFPILEYYTCTAEEKQALRDKIKYNGMTVMRIGKIEDYLQIEPSYIKGQLIRLQVNEDNHLLEAIRQEVNKGVYV